MGLADRSLMPGDVVRRLIAGKDTQRGYCRDIVMTAALQVVGTKHVIQSVASERLQPLEEFTPDLAVCLDSWVGTSKVIRFYSQNLLYNKLSLWLIIFQVLMK